MVLLEGEYENYRFHPVHFLVGIKCRVLGISKEDLEQARQHHETVLSAKAEIEKVYHPHNLKTGQRQDTEAVSDLKTVTFCSNAPAAP